MDPASRSSKERRQKTDLRKQDSRLRSARKLDDTTTALRRGSFADLCVLGEVGRREVDAHVLVLRSEESARLAKQAKNDTETHVSTVVDLAADSLDLVNLLLRQVGQLLRERKLLDPLGVA